eukprot:scaffold153_cov347-Pavlova_lutheri.AAC.58
MSSVSRSGSVSVCLRLSPIRLRSSSRLMTLRVNSSPTPTTLLGCTTGSQDSSETWTNPSAPRTPACSWYTSTNAPKSASILTFPLHVMPTSSFCTAMVVAAAFSERMSTLPLGSHSSTRTTILVPTSFASLVSLGSFPSATRSASICDMGTNPASLPTRSTTPPRLAASTRPRNRDPVSFILVARLQSRETFPSAPEEDAFARAIADAMLVDDAATCETQDVSRTKGKRMPFRTRRRRPIRPERIPDRAQSDPRWNEPGPKMWTPPPRGSLPFRKERRRSDKRVPRTRPNRIQTMEAMAKPARPFFVGAHACANFDGRVLSKTHETNVCIEDAR